ncbi:MAG: hypothetical protein AAGA18_00760 [Verrucomicrobiota bacterium]
MMSENVEYLPAGTFPVYEAEYISSLLEKNKIDYEVEMDDSEIKNMTPCQASIGGTFGLGAKVHFYVHPDSLEVTVKLLDDEIST